MQTGPEMLCPIFIKVPILCLKTVCTLKICLIRVLTLYLWSRPKKYLMRSTMYLIGLRGIAVWCPMSLFESFVKELKPELKSP